MEEYDREAPLFDRRFHVLVQYPDRDEKLLPLTIRLLTGVRQNNAKNQKERVMRVEITDDDGADPYFLYLWSVSEEEFHELKAQQKLLVDFATFPANLIELLQCCLKDSKAIVQEDAEKEQKRSSIDAQHSRSAGPIPLSYLAVLNTSDSDGMSVFSIVETNPFKQLTHLSLRFYPGDDAAIKAYLAARLAQVGASRRSLATSLKQTTEELQGTQKSEAKLQQQLAALGYEAESTLSQEKMKFADELETQRRAATSALKQREDELNAKIDVLVERYEKEKTAEASEAQVQELSRQKYQHELQIEHLRAQSQDLSQGSSALSGEVGELRSQNKELDQKVFLQEKQINALQVRADALQQQLADKEEVVKKTTDLLQAAKVHSEEVDESLKMYRDNHARLQQKLELSISEINKGNEIIERIQNENRTLKAKMRMKVKIIKQQEHFVEEKQLQREEALLELKSTKEDIRKRDEHILQLKDTIKELSQKLEDSNKLLASNQQVITWLNKEINEAQLGRQRRSTAHPSVLAFRPSDKVSVVS
ncbi:spindle assembly protein, putative [Phytophthora infestans T30-4]|uniref:Spindle assembly protein, putative n=1 Tax=Phytophthora infestans (strain T30-4) TaxID=403677 RepID=D0N628_PHYIT|nr:spindle assembly protein, putative [Phytophthora infestans T30-4]EEY70519.1 spindle assembly protein, putative [Phytophthora infestans T30-4]|eukprot:XP_002998173.1 spindle assembly protein, putative [Phytophthora infestans T30-4]